MTFRHRIGQLEAQNGVSAVSLAGSYDIVWCVFDDSIALISEPRVRARGSFIQLSPNDPDYVRVASPPCGASRVVLRDFRDGWRFWHSLLSTMQEFSLLSREERQRARPVYEAAGVDLAEIEETPAQRALAVEARKRLAHANDELDKERKLASDDFVRRMDPMMTVEQYGAYLRRPHRSCDCCPSTAPHFDESEVERLFDARFIQFRRYVSQNPPLSPADAVLSYIGLPTSPVGPLPLSLPWGGEE